MGKYLYSYTQVVYTVVYTVVYVLQCTLNICTRVSVQSTGKQLIKSVTFYSVTFSLASWMTSTTRVYGPGLVLQLGFWDKSTRFRISDSPFYAETQGVYHSINRQYLLRKAKQIPLLPWPYTRMISRMNV